MYSLTFKTIIIISLNLYGFNIFSQNPTSAGKSKNEKTISHTFVLNYPKAAFENKIEGDVILSYDIDSSCTILNKKIVKGLGYGCDEEALRYLSEYQKMLRKWGNIKCNPTQDLRCTIKFSLSVE